MLGVGEVRGKVWGCEKVQGEVWRELWESTWGERGGWWRVCGGR